MKKTRGDKLNLFRLRSPFVSSGRQALRLRYHKKYGKEKLFRHGLCRESESVVMRFADKRISLTSSAQRILILTCVSLVVLFAAASMVYAMSKRVAIVDDGNRISVVTFSSTVENVLTERGIALDERDIISVPITEKLTDKQEITIVRAKPVKIFDDNEVTEVYTTQADVAALLAEQGLRVGLQDNMNVSFEDIICRGMEIKIDRVHEDYLTTLVEVPYRRIRRATFNLEQGQTRVASVGSNGTTQEIYKISYRNGEEVSRTLSQTKVLKEPVSEIIEYGTAGVLASRGGLKYKAVMDMTATAYDDCYQCNGNNLKRAANGMRLGRGIVAVDPSVIPLGSKVYVETADGRFVYGNAVAADTGGAIKGNKIDLCFDSKDEVRAFGRRSVKVYLLQ